MSDNIQIHVPHKFYKAGDNVSGLVMLTAKDNNGQIINIESISITFSGRLTCTREWRPKSLSLFTFKKTLLAGPKTLYISSNDSEDQFSWPFTFTFPVDCNAIQNDGLPTPPLPLFNADRNQPLPPSFPASSNESNSRPDTASITYELQATLSSPSTLEKHQILRAQRLQLTLYAPRDREQPRFECILKTQRLSCQSTNLIPEEQRGLAKRPLGLREKLGLKSPRTEHLPKAVFDAKLQIPASAIIGEGLPVKLHIDYDSESSTTQAPPAIHLKKMFVWLREYTAMLVPKQGSVAGEQEQAGWTKAFQLAHDFDGEVLLTNGIVDIRNLIDLTLKDDLIPTFKTFTVARSYGTKVHAILECAGKEFYVFSDYSPCTLLAKQFDPDSPQYVQPDVPVIMTDDVDDPPPPYEKVEQSGSTSLSSDTNQQGRRRKKRHHGAFQNIAFLNASSSSGGGGGGGGGSVGGAC